MQKIDPAQSITVDGTSYEVADFSADVQRLVAIYADWQNELVEERLAVAKTEAALRGLNAELTQLVQKEIAAKAEVASAPAEATSDTAEA